MDYRTSVFINAICSDLQIECPQVIVKETGFPTPTMMAMCSSDGKSIILRKDKSGLDLFFAIAHELRHVWQIRNKKQMFLSEYFAAAQSTKEDYNHQLAEIDANAYGAKVMLEAFGVEAQFRGLDGQTRRMIYERMEEI